MEEEGNEELEVETDQLLVFQMNENELDEVSTLCILCVRKVRTDAALMCHCGT